MTIISKKAFRFELRKGKSVVDVREVRPHILVGGLPDWVKDTELFKLAVKDGSITFVESQKPTPASNVLEGNVEGKADGEDSGDANGEDVTHPEGVMPEAFKTPDEVAALGRADLLAYAAHIGVEGFQPNIQTANLQSRVNTFIADKLAAVAPQE